MRRIVFFIIMFTILSGSCRNKNYRVNINDIELDLSITRLENILFGNDPAWVYEGLDSLSNAHPGILTYLSYLINIGNIDDPGWSEGLMNFITSRQNVEVYRSTAEIYEDIREIEEEMEVAWKHYRYYFPDAGIPEIYTCISGFNSSYIIGNEVIGISLDRYLGRDSEYYPMLGIYNYQTLWMIREKIVSDCMYAWASSTWINEDNEDKSTDVMNAMIHEGRLLYFTKCMLPDEEDTLLFRFTEMQMQFVVNNEQQIWEYLVEHDMLFSTDPLLLKKLTGDAPFTSYFTSESPGRAANWIGYRIVESFMRKNPDVSLSDLMKEDKLPSILERSKYSPG